MIGTPINDPKWWHFATMDGHKITVHKVSDDTFEVILDGVLVDGQTWTSVEDAKNAAITSLED